MARTSRPILEIPIEDSVSQHRSQKETRSAPARLPERRNPLANGQDAYGLPPRWARPQSCPQLRGPNLPLRQNDSSPPRFSWRFLTLLVIPLLVLHRLAVSTYDQLWQNQSLTSTEYLQNISRAYGHFDHIISAADNIEYLPRLLPQAQGAVSRTLSRVTTNTLRFASQPLHLTLGQVAAVNASVSFTYGLVGLAADQAEEYHVALESWLDTSVSILNAFPPKLDYAADLERVRSRHAARLVRLQELYLSKHRYTIHDVLYLTTGSLHWEVCSVDTLVAENLYLHIRFLSESTALILQKTTNLFALLAQLYDSLQELKLTAADQHVPNLEQALISVLETEMWLPSWEFTESEEPPSNFDTFSKWVQKLANLQRHEQSDKQRIYPSLDVVVHTAMVHVAGIMRRLWHLKRDLCSLQGQYLSRLPNHDRRWIVEAEEKHTERTKKGRSFFCGDGEGSHGFVDKMLLELRDRAPVHLPSYSRTGSKRGQHDTSRHFSTVPFSVRTKPSEESRNPTTGDDQRVSKSSAAFTEPCHDPRNATIGTDQHVAALQRGLRALATALSPQLAQHTAHREQRRHRWKADWDVLGKETVEDEGGGH